MRLPLMTLFSTALAACLAAAPAHAQSAGGPVARPIAEVNLNALVGETQKMSEDPQLMELVWWMPPEFWERSLMDSTLSAKEQRETVTLFRKYVVFAVVKGEMGNFGMKRFSDEDELRAELRLVGADGKRIAPIARDALDPELEVLFTVLRPLMASIIGPMGQNMQLFAFPATDKAGNRVGDALAAGTVRLEVGRATYAYDTPLPSLLAPMYDASGREFPGTYRFNPYTGAPLQAAPAKQK